MGQPSPPRFLLSEFHRGTCKATTSVRFVYVNGKDPQDTAEVFVSLRQPKLANMRPFNLDHEYQLSRRGLAVRE